MSDISAASSVSAALRQVTSSNDHASYAASRHGSSAGDVEQTGAVKFSADGGISADPHGGSSTVNQILNFLA